MEKKMQLNEPNRHNSRLPPPPLTPEKTTKAAASPEVERPFIKTQKKKWEMEHEPEYLGRIIS